MGVFFVGEKIFIKIFVCFFFNYDRVFFAWEQQNFGRIFDEGDFFEYWFKLLIGAVEGVEFLVLI